MKVQDILNEVTLSMNLDTKESGNADLLIDDLMSKSNQNPMGGDRYMQRGNGIVRFALHRKDKDTVLLSSLEVTDRGKGFARDFMEDLTDRADEYGVTIHIIPAPMDEETDKERLLDFYSRYNFRSRGGLRMERLPR